MGLVVGAAVASAVFVLVPDEDDDGSGNSAASEPDEVTRMLVVTRELSGAMSREREAVQVTMLGQEGMLVDVGDIPSTRAETDEAVGVLRDTVASLDSSAADQYGHAVDALAGLDEIRADIDAHTGPRNLGQLEPVVLPLHRRYSELISTVHDGQETFASSLTDSERRTSAQLHALALRQHEAYQQLIRLVVFGTVNADQSAAFVTELATWKEDYEQGWAELTDGAAGTAHQAAADQLAAALVDDTVTRAAEDVLAAAQVDISSVLASVSLEAHWLDFAQEIERDI